MWTLADAERYLDSLSQALTAMRVSAQIVGSVALRGSSNKDLDIVLQPIPGVVMTTECGLAAIEDHLLPLMADGDRLEPLDTSWPEDSWFVNLGTKDGRTVEFYLPERLFPNVHPEELGLPSTR